MKLSLGEFQDAFVGALYGADSPELAQLIGQPGFQVYRNTVLKGASDALLANFPTVERLVGTEWLRAAAGLHIHASPPTDARLLYYGAEFPAFLDGFEHAQEMPYLGNVARLDRLWNEVHSAADEPGIDLASFASIAPADLAQTQLKPRAAARWQWFPEQPAYTIWRVNREQLDMPDPLEWVGEGALLTRKTGRVDWQPLDIGGCAFLDACAAQLPLEQAAQTALDVQPSLDFMALLTCLITADVFARGPLRE